MTRIENRIVSAVLRYQNSLFFIFALLLGLVARWNGRNFLSGDMKTFLLPWFDEIKARGGLESLSAQVGDYGLLYQTFISAMTYVDVNPLYGYKLLSVVFDVALMAVVGLILWREQKSDIGQKAFCLLLCMAVVFLLPTVVFNSAYWGQCDSMYTVFVLATLYLVSRDSFKWAFACLGMAFACKLQAVFVMPFLAAYYLKSRKFSVLYLVITLLVFWASGIVAFLYGRNLLAPFTIYQYQTGEWPYLFVDFPSFWVLTGNELSLKIFAVLITFGLCAAGVLFYLRDKREDKAVFYPYAAWFVWTMVLFLPSMHDRYAYLLDILLVLMSFMDKRYVKYAVVCCCISLWAYGSYLFGLREASASLELRAVLFLIMYAVYSWQLLAPDSRMSRAGLQRVLK